MHTHRRPGQTSYISFDSPSQKIDVLTWLATARTVVSGTSESGDMMFLEEPVLCIWRNERNAADGGLFLVKSLDGGEIM